MRGRIAAQMVSPLEAEFIQTEVGQARDQGVERSAALKALALAGAKSCQRRSLFGDWSSRRLTGSLSSGALRPIRRRLINGRALSRSSSGAIAAHLHRFDPIDRSPKLVGPINRDRIAALAQDR